MIWALRGSPPSRPRELPDHIERRLTFALARFGRWIDKVVVFLQDANGRKGGIDKMCRVLVKARGCGVITAVAADSDWTAAVDKATKKIGETVAQQIDRQRSRRGVSPRHAAWPGQSAGVP